MPIENRVKLLIEISEHFNQIKQWFPMFAFDKASEYNFKAESLIEFLEVEDCGSVGGYDNKNKLPKQCRCELYDRFLALVYKYDNITDVNKKVKQYGYSIQSLCDFLNKIKKVGDFV